MARFHLGNDGRRIAYRNILKRKEWPQTIVVNHVSYNKIRLTSSRTILSLHKSTTGQDIEHTKGENHKNRSNRCKGFMIRVNSSPENKKIRPTDMRKKLKQYKFIILAIFLMTGVSIVGWTFGFHYDNQVKNAGPQKEFKNEILTANVMPSAIDHSKIILLLVCTGIVGFFGVRRQNNTLKTFVKKRRPELKLHLNLLRQDNLESQTCHLQKTGCVAS